MWRNSIRQLARKGLNSYKACSLITFTAIFVFAVMNVAVFVAYKVKDRAALFGRPKASNNVIKILGMPGLREAYPNYKDEEIRSLIRESWDRGLEYDPFTQYKERVYAGKSVNVHQSRFRLSKNNGPWPPDPENLNIFLFGGSTTFGYGVCDDQTIASHLQEFLADHSKRAVKVYNFGSGCFFSTQERTRFSNFLVQGFVPNVAVFIDGLNDFLMYSGEPLFSSDVGKLWEERERGDSVRKVLSELPIRRLIDTISTRLAHIGQGPESSTRRVYDESTKIMTVLNRYSENKRLIEAAAHAYNVHPVFIWQPIPSYHYHLRHYLADPAKEGLLATTKLGYTTMAGIVKDNRKDYTRDFLWLADAQEQFQESLYVDSFHYNDKFSSVIAAHVGRFLLDRGTMTTRVARIEPPPRNSSLNAPRQSD